MQIRMVLDYLKVPALETVTNLLGGSPVDPTFATIFIQPDLEHVGGGKLSSKDIHQDQWMIIG